MPLSHAQERMWLLHQLEAGNPAYNIPAVLRLRGPLDVARLRAALFAVGARHEVLRTYVTERDGLPVATVGEEPGSGSRWPNRSRPGTRSGRRWSGRRHKRASRSTSGTGRWSG
ncbi:condensation domain-containing protein [Streptomyces sp. M19]